MQAINTTKTSWDLSPLLAGDNDPKIKKEQKEITEQSYAFISKWKDRTDYTTDPKVLVEAMNEYELWLRNYGTAGKQGFYFHLREAQDQTDPKIKAESNKINDFSLKILNDIQFFEFQIARIDQKKQASFLKEKGLLPYKHFLEQTFENAKYLLTDAEERILNLKSATSRSNWIQMTESNLSKQEKLTLLENGKKEKRPFESLMSLMLSQNKKVRDDAAKNINVILLQFVDMAEAEMNSLLKDKQVNDELRHITRPDQVRHISDDIDTDVVDALVNAVTNRFDIAKRFYALKAKMMKQDVLAYHERNVEVAQIDKNYTFDEAVSIVYKVFVRLDPEFGKIFKGFIENGQMDVFPKVGKNGGAFCAGNLITHPTYILLNYTEKLRDLMTIAHETGHGINNELIKKQQNSLNYGTPMSTAEVASTFMEDFVFDEVLQGADEELQLAVLMQRMNDSISTIFRQVACYNFETELHTSFREKGYLSNEEIGIIFQKNMGAYMGDAVGLDKGSENWWVYWSHIRNFFYVYSYASGLLISKAMQNSVRKDKAFISQVKTFLSSGMSDSPKNIFMKMGIDITDVSFWNKGLDEIDALLTQTEALAKKLKKI